MGSLLKNYGVYAMVVVLTACQTPTGSNQTPASSNATGGIGQSAARSSPNEIDTFGPLFPPNFPRYQGGSVRGP
jgi:hypothetical protein